MLVGLKLAELKIAKKIHGNWCQLLIKGSDFSYTYIIHINQMHACMGTHVALSHDRCRVIITHCV